MSSDPFSNLPPGDSSDEDDRTVIRPSARPPAQAPVPAPAPAALPQDAADEWLPPVAPEPAQPNVTGSPASIPIPPTRPPHTAGMGTAAIGGVPGDHGNTLPVGTYVGEFEVTDTLGEGGFGIVYLAWDHSLERKVALKEYMPAALAARGQGLTVTVKSARHAETFEAGLRSFVNEAKLLAQFDHPSMVKVYRFWEANGTAYMVMPFYEGTTLKDTLKEMGGTPPDEAWLTALLAPVSEALEVLHGQQCYHRDIAPDNIILLKGTGKPLLLDFGAARRVIGDMTQALTVILKSGYAPVEQYAEVPGMNQGPWTDVYALAASVYYAINGKTPPPAVGRLVNDSYVPLAQSAAGKYSDRFLRAIDHALAVKPEERIQNMAQLREELGLGAGYVPPTTMPSPTGGPAKGTAGGTSATPTKGQGKPAKADKAEDAGSGGRNRLPVIIGGVVAALAVAGGIGYTLMGGQKDAATAGTAASAASAVVATAPDPAPASAPAPVEPAAPSGPFDPIKEFDRIVTNASAGFTVEGAPIKPRLQIGKDRLGFSFTSSKSGYAYVLLVSTDGTFMKLFPNRIAPSNHIEAGEHIHLPDKSWPMDAAGPAGTDHFVVIVSSRPRDFTEAGGHSEGGFTEFPREEAEAAWRKHKGAGSVFAGKPICDAGAPCSDDYGAAHFTLEEFE
jgi:serine/threonine protein kinase